jgi:leucine-rich repeat protein SHOC2
METKNFAWLSMNQEEDVAEESKISINNIKDPQIGYLKSKITDKGELSYSNNNLWYLPRSLLLYEFTQIVSLNISKNAISEINENMIKSLPSLIELDASHNKIVFITAMISQWSGSLRKLVLSHNNLNEIPNEISKLEKLQYLVLDNNKIEYLPSEIWYLEKLKLLDISDNFIKSLPYDLGNLKSLKKLHISNNHNLTSK